MPFEGRELNAEQRAALDSVRAARRIFISALHLAGGTDPKEGRMASANLTLALRHIEDAESRAERHIKGGHAD